MYLRVPMPAVSVIIPVFNVEPYVARCARSLFEQTLEDIEYIFVDDCTPDRSIDIVKEVLADYPKREEQGTFVRTPRNGGLARARVFGLKHAKGGYIIHCDSDDAVKPDAYRLMYEKAVSESLDIVTCDFELIGEKKSRVESQFTEPGREIGDILTAKVWSNVWCRMSRRNLWDNVILPRGDMWEDMAFTIQVISKATRIGYIPIPLYLYYRRLGSISCSRGMQAAIKRWRSQVDNAELVTEYLSKLTYASWKPSDVVAFKYISRGPLIRYIKIPQFYRRWRDTFPEVDSVYLQTRDISFQKKFDYCLIRLHLYSLCNNPYREIRRIIRRMYYRVFFNCKPPVC